MRRTGVAALVATLVTCVAVLVPASTSPSVAEPVETPAPSASASGACKGFGCVVTVDQPATPPPNATPVDADPTVVSPRAAGAAADEYGDGGMDPCIFEALLDLQGRPFEGNVSVSACDSEEAEEEAGPSFEEIAAYISS